MAAARIKSVKHEPNSRRMINLSKIRVARSRRGRCDLPPPSQKCRFVPGAALPPSSAPSVPAALTLRPQRVVGVIEQPLDVDQRIGSLARQQDLDAARRCP
jgi:hypothetical protein